jgi:hypothetical protein
LRVSTYLKAVLYYNTFMTLFQHQLWGYQILLPEGWQHKNFGDKDGFAVDLKAFEPDYQGDTLAQLLIHGEWNSLKKPVADVWQRHLGKVSLMLGAKNLASAPWEMAGARGHEVEIVLPKKNPQRLWTGILENGMLVLSFMALHWKDSREEMEPVLSGIIASLEYLQGIQDLPMDETGLPLPSGAVSVDPQSIVDDISDSENWRAYHTEHNPGALQAFYLRELPGLDWNISRYVPFPNNGELPFARVLVEKDGRTYSLGIMPEEEGDSGSIVLRTFPK